MFAAIVIQLIIAVLGLGGLIQFIGEEAVQASGMGLYMALRDENWLLASKALKDYSAVNKFNVDWLLPSGGVINPILYSPFLLFSAAALESEKTYNELILDHLQKEKLPTKGYIRIVSQPTDAKIFVWEEEGRWVDTTKLTPETFEYEIPKLHYYALSRYDARKKLYRQALIRAAPIPDIRKELSVNLYTTFLMNTEEIPYQRNYFIEKRTMLFI